MPNYRQVILPPPARIREETTGIIQLGPKAYIVDREQMITYGRLDVNILEEEGFFRFGVWVEIEVKEIERLAKEKKGFACRGKLIANLPFYNEGKGAAVTAVFDRDRSDFHEPSVFLNEKHLQSYQHQQTGLPLESYLEWMRILQTGALRFDAS